MHWHGADPHRLGRLPGLQPRRAAQAERGGRALPLAGQRRRGVPEPGDLDARSRPRSTRTSSWCSTSARRTRRPRPSGARSRWNCRCAGRARSRARVRRGCGNPNALFGIVQGGTHLALRARVARASCASIGFDGYAIGGLAVGEPADERNRVLEALRAAHAARPAALPDGRRHARPTSSRPSRAASTCSTA